MTAGLPYWQRQEPGKPLFPDLLWSRPENKQYAGKLLIVGGNAYGFAAPAEAYQEAGKAGIGVARVLLPDALQKTVGKVFLAGEYAPSTPSGSFSQKALLELLDMAQWADGVLIDGNLGRNSETAILLEKFIEKYSGQLTLSNDGADYFITPQATILERPDTLLVLNFAQLQKLAVHAHFATAFTSSMDLLHFVTAMHEFTADHHAYLAVQHLGNLVIAVGGKVSTTKLPPDAPPQASKTAAHASVWWLQNPEKPFEALTVAVGQ
jgi:ADP-dependent NAD(P)H-hydrate dehydratase / NAD(P)H-hydrate epimerase